MQYDIIRSSGEVIDAGHKLLLETGAYERVWAKQKQRRMKSALEPDPNKAFRIYTGVDE